MELANESKTLLGDLSTDILRYVTSFLSFDDVLRVAETSKRNNAALSARCVWKHRYVEFYDAMKSKFYNFWRQYHIYKTFPVIPRKVSDDGTRGMFILKRRVAHLVQERRAGLQSDVHNARWNGLQRMQQRSQSRHHTSSIKSLQSVRTQAKCDSTFERHAAASRDGK